MKSWTFYGVEPELYLETYLEAVPFLPVPGMKWVSPDEKLRLLSYNLCPAIRYKQSAAADKSAFLLSGLAKVFHLQSWTSRRLSYSLLNHERLFQLPAPASVCSPCCGINAELLFKFLLLPSPSSPIPSSPHWEHVLLGKSSFFESQCNPWDTVCYQCTVPE